MIPNSSLKNFVYGSILSKIHCFINIDHNTCYRHEDIIRICSIKKTELKDIE